MELRGYRYALFPCNSDGARMRPDKKNPDIRTIRRKLSIMMINTYENFQKLLEEKTKTAEEAVATIQSGDRVYYSEFVTIPAKLDAALAKRVNELHDIHIDGSTMRMNSKTFEVDPEHKVFDINDRSLTPQSRKMGAFYLVGSYEENVKSILEYRHADAAFIAACPMDKNGYFNLGTTCSNQMTLLETCKNIIIEVNDKIPHCPSGQLGAFHISQVAAVVYGDNVAMEELPAVGSNEADKKIADLLMEHLHDGCCLQLGIGGIPNKIGEAIVDSDVKHLGVHTEMMMNSFMNLYKAGKIDNSCKNINKGQMVYTFAMGSQELYDFLDYNEGALRFPSNYTNDPYVIGQNDNVFAVNNGLKIDLFSQVSSESVGPRQISGVGGQWDFIYGAFLSKGGKGFVCMNSTAMVKDKDGSKHRESRIVPTFEPGTITSVPRYHTFYCCTEFGCINMKGLSTWERAEKVIELAHPDYRDELIQSADSFGLWRASNKR